MSTVSAIGWQMSVTSRTDVNDGGSAPSWHFTITTDHLIMANLIAAIVVAVLALAINVVLVATYCRFESVRSHDCVHLIAAASTAAATSLVGSGFYLFGELAWFLWRLDLGGVQCSIVVILSYFGTVTYECLIFAIGIDRLIVYVSPMQYQQGRDPLIYTKRCLIVSSLVGASLALMPPLLKGGVVPNWDRNQLVCDQWWVNSYGGGWYLWNYFHLISLACSAVAFIVTIVVMRQRVEESKVAGRRGSVAECIRRERAVTALLASTVVAHLLLWFLPTAVDVVSSLMSADDRRPGHLNRYSSFYTMQLLWPINGVVLAVGCLFRYDILGGYMKMLVMCMGEYGRGRRSRGVTEATLANNMNMSMSIEMAPPPTPKPVAVINPSGGAETFFGAIIEPYRQLDEEAPNGEPSELTALTKNLEAVGLV